MIQDQMKGLAMLRADIDRVDDQILNLLGQRLATSRRVAALKIAEGNRYLKIRPKRQADILRRLKSRRNCVPARLIDCIWREIMAESLRAQAPTELVLAPSERPQLVEALVRDRFGTLTPIRHAESEAEALRAAAADEAIAILPEPMGHELGLRPFDRLCSQDGQTIAFAVGRIAPEEPAIWPEPDDECDKDIMHLAWAPASWRSRALAQPIDYPDSAALACIEQRLSATAPLVEIGDIVRLRESLSRVARGQGLLIQGGDCAESFAEFSCDKVWQSANLLLQIGSILRTAAGSDPVHLARIAGQFTKPRSSASETVGELTLPIYRGDAVNGAEFTAEARTPDPERLLKAHRQSRITMDLLNAFTSAVSIDGQRGHGRPSRRPAIFTSHESLLLNTEQALARFDEESGQWWASSGHLLWIGDRTRQLDGAHVEFARGIANPIGLKCGPTLGADELLRLIDRLDPGNVPGRLVLIGRFGAAKIAAHLPDLLQATRREGRHVLWTIDPMHGNTQLIEGLKTRAIVDVLAEIRSFFEIAAAENMHPGGVHLEMTGSNVTECIGGSENLDRKDLEQRYLTHCDPRLNEKQAIEVAHAIAELLIEQSLRRANAA